MTATPIECALCCGPTCGRTRPEHGECVAATHGRAQLERLKAAGYAAVPRVPTVEMWDAADLLGNDGILPRWNAMIAAAEWQGT